MIDENTLTTLFENTAAVLGAAPGSQDEVRMALQQARGQAQNADQHDALAALTALLEQGVGALDDLTPTVPAAYRDQWDALAMQLHRPLSFEQLSAILRKTAAVMSQPPVKKKGWKEGVQNLARQADQYGDLDGRNFLVAVVALIERGTSAFGELTASVPESYVDVWNALGILLHQPIKPDAC